MYEQHPSGSLAVIAVTSIVALTGICFLLFLAMFILGDGYLEVDSVSEVSNRPIVRESAKEARITLRTQGGVSSTNSKLYLLIDEGEDSDLQSLPLQLDSYSDRIDWKYDSPVEYSIKRASSSIGASQKKPQS